MTEQLPISIYVCNDLTEQWVNINSITNKLSAQFNFHAMRANWYGDEDNILYIQLLLETPQGFTIQMEKQQTKQAKTFEVYSDDVFSFIDEQEPQQLICTVAITESEHNLLAQQTKLLSGLLQIKLQKVLNIIAKQLNLKAI
jgi:hypothetical protein